MYTYKSREEPKHGFVNVTDLPKQLCISTKINFASNPSYLANKGLQNTPN